MVAATLFICLVSFMVWLHHFFTMGAGGDVNAVFGIATSIIAVGTGVKVYNWMFTMYGGGIRYATPMLWSVGFIVTFIIGADRRSARGSAGRFPIAQQSFPSGAFPQCHHRRRAVRRLC